MINYYDNIAHGYWELYGKEQLKKIRLILDHIKLDKHDKVLDVGCGNGSYLNMFDCDLTGIDPSENLIKQYEGKHKVMIGKAENIPFPDNTFDLVMSITAIQNFDNMRKGLYEIRRVGNNKFILTVLKKAVDLDEMDLLIRGFFIIEKIIIEDKDYIFFCKKSFSK